MENIIDWEEFVDKILDGKFSFDIRKMGSASMFVKNQLGSMANPNMEKGRFRKSLVKAVEDRPFDTDESLNDPVSYSVLMDLGVEFLVSDATYIKKCCALFIQLNDLRQHPNMKNGEDISGLLTKSSFSIIKFIENWKNLNEILGIKDIYGQHIFIKYVMQKWQARVTAPEALMNPNILLGLIYLDEWSGFTEKDKRNIFNNNAGNHPLFSSIISDMERLEGNRVFNYFDFVSDCNKYDAGLIKVISERCDSWIRHTGIHDTPEQSPTEKGNIKSYNDWIHHNTDLDGSSLRSYIDKELNKN